MVNGGTVKRTKRDVEVGRQQAKLFADCLEKQFDQRPAIFYSTGTTTGCGTTPSILRAKCKDSITCGRM